MESGAKQHDLPIKCLVSINTSNFHPLEVVGRGSGTQLQVGETINNVTWWVQG